MNLSLAIFGHQKSNCAFCAAKRPQGQSRENRQERSAAETAQSKGKANEDRSDSASDLDTDRFAEFCEENLLRFLVGHIAAALMRVMSACCCADIPSRWGSRFRENSASVSMATKPQFSANNKPCPGCTLRRRFLAKVTRRIAGVFQTRPNR